MYVIDRHATSPPYIKQSGDVLLSLRIVALAPVRLIDAFLHVYNYEGRALRQNNYAPRTVVRHSPLLYLLFVYSFYGSQAPPVLPYRTSTIGSPRSTPDCP